MKIGKTLTIYVLEKSKVPAFSKFMILDAIKSDIDQKKGRLL